jgi:protease I
VNALEGKKVAIVVANGFEQVEMTDPKKALEEAGGQTDIVSPEKGTVRKPDDIPAFNRKMIEEFEEGRHEERPAV